MRKLDVWQNPIEPTRQPPGPITDQIERRRNQHKPDEERIEQYRCAKDKTHLLHRQCAGDGEGIEDGNHDTSGGDDGPAGVAERPLHSLVGIMGSLVVFARRGQQEDRVVHRNGKHDSEE